MLLTSEYCFLATPRTASRSMKELLRKRQEDIGEAAIESKEHHVHPADLQREMGELYDRVPIYTMIRDPYDQVVSWFYHAVVRQDKSKETTRDLSEFIRTRSVGWYFNERLNPYHSVKGIDHIPISPYTDEFGLSFAYHRITGEAIPKNREVCIGLLPRKKRLMTPWLRKLVRQRFPDDIELWTISQQNYTDIPLTSGKRLYQHQRS